MAAQWRLTPLDGDGQMQVDFHGAAGEVTGSMHLVHAAGRQVLLDCGLLQGRRELEARNADPFPFEPASLDAVVLSHAHIDHIGRVPLLVARGFDGLIWLHGATADLLPVMLEDAASLAESEAQRANRHRDPEQPRICVHLFRGNAQTRSDFPAEEKSEIPARLQGEAYRRPIRLGEGRPFRKEKQRHRQSAHDPVRHAAPRRRITAPLVPRGHRSRHPRRSLPRW